MGSNSSQATTLSRRWKPAKYPSFRQDTYSVCIKVLSRQVEASSGKPVCCNGRSRIDSPSPSSQRTGRYRDGNFHGCQVHSTTERELAANAHLSSYSGCVHPGHHPASPHAYLCVVPPGLVAPMTLTRLRTGMQGCGDAPASLRAAGAACPVVSQPCSRLSARASRMGLCIEDGRSRPTSDSADRDVRQRSFWKWSALQELIFFLAPEQTRVKRKAGAIVAGTRTTTRPGAVSKHQALAEALMLPHNYTRAWERLRAQNTSYE